MNTVFKLGYQAWLLLALAGALRARRGRRWLPRAARAAGRRARRGAAAARRSSTRYAGTSRARAASTTHRRSTACGWLRARAPGDSGAIDWLRAQHAGDAVVLEAVGDDYSAFGHGAHLDLHRPPDRDGLGRPRAAVGARPRHAAADVETLYTATDADGARRAARPLRHRLRRRRPDRADDLRRRSASSAGSGRPSSTAAGRRSTASPPLAGTCPSRPSGPRGCADHRPEAVGDEGGHRAGQDDAARRAVHDEQADHA